MNREIEFRGYCSDLGRWIYGDLIYCGSELTEHYTRIEPRMAIAEEGMPAHEVDRKTVGEYSGFKDLNGEKLYEGDACYIYGHDVIRETVKYSVLTGQWVFEFEDLKLARQTVFDGRQAELYVIYQYLIKCGTLHDEYIKQMEEIKEDLCILKS